MAEYYIWVKNQRYYYHDTYSSYEKARKIADYYRKKNNSRFFIRKVEEGFLFPKIVYKLYLTKIMRILMW